MSSLNFNEYQKQWVEENLKIQRELGAKETVSKIVAIVEKINTKEHICRFNDGEQNCDCYIEAKDDIINLLNNRE